MCLFNLEKVMILTDNTFVRSDSWSGLNFQNSGSCQIPPYLKGFITYITYLSSRLYGFMIPHANKFVKCFFDKKHFHR